MAFLFRRDNTIRDVLEKALDATPMLDVRGAIHSLHIWNISMEKQLRGCTRPAASWTRYMIEENRMAIAELNMLRRD